MPTYLENCNRVCELREKIAEKRNEMKHVIRRIAEEEVFSHRITEHVYNPENIGFVRDVIQFDDKVRFEREQSSPLKDIQAFLYSVTWNKKEKDAVLEVMNPDLTGNFFEKVNLKNVIDPEGMCDYFFGNAYRRKVADTELYKSLLNIKNELMELGKGGNELLREIEIQNMNIIMENKSVSLPHYRKIMKSDIDDEFLAKAWSEPTWGVPAHYLDRTRTLAMERPCLIIAARWSPEDIPNPLPSPEYVLVHIIDTKWKVDKIITLAQLFEEDAMSEFFHLAGVLKSSK